MITIWRVLPRLFFFVDRYSFVPRILRFHFSRCPFPFICDVHRFFEGDDNFRSLSKNFQTDLNDEYEPSEWSFDMKARERTIGSVPICFGTDGGVLFDCLMVKHGTRSLLVKRTKGDNWIWSSKEKNWRKKELDDNTAILWKWADEEMLIELVGRVFLFVLSTMLVKEVLLEVS